MTDEEPTESADTGDGSGTGPEAPEMEDCWLAGISFMLALPPLTISGLVFVMPDGWDVALLVLGWVMTAAGLMTGIRALGEIAASNGRLRGRGMAWAGTGMASLAIIGLAVSTVMLIRLP